jgi:small conductance mechanosensitive channel
MQTPDTLTTAPPEDLTTTVGKLAGKLADWLDALVLALPNLVVALVVVVLAAVVARVVRRGLHAVLLRASARTPSARNVVDLLSTLAYVVVLAVGTFVALGVLRLDGVVTSLLAGAGIVGLALGFAFQDIASNFIAGVMMAVRSPFLIGQTVETNGVTGVIKDLSLRSTTIDTPTGQRVIVPNAKVFGEVIVNHSARGEQRVDVTCGVGYDADLRRAQAVAVAAGEAVDGRLESRPVEAFFHTFGESAVEFTLRVWFPYTGIGAHRAAQSRVVIALREAFDREGIGIPFPIRTLDLSPDVVRALAPRGDA